LPWRRPDTSDAANVNPVTTCTLTHPVSGTHDIGVVNFGAAQ